MKTASITSCLVAGSVVALALLATAPTASAGSLAGSGALFSGQLQQQAKVEDVRWVRRCWQERRWWNGRPHWVTRCKNVWVGRPRYRW